MKVSSRLTNYYKDCIDSIESILRMPKEEWHVTHFHKLRVNLKKFRAVLELIHFYSSEIKKKKYFKPYKNIFQQAGKIREVQLEKLALVNLKLSESMPIYWKYLNAKEETEKEQFYLLKNEKGIDKIISSSKEIYSCTKEINNAAVEKFLNRQRAKIERLIKKQGFKKSKLHKLRKKVKVFYYIIKIFPSGKKPSGKKVAKFQELLGDWHDHMVLKNQLKEMLLSDILPDSEKELVQKQIEEVRDKSAKLYEKIKSNKGFC